MEYTTHIHHHYLNNFVITQQIFIRVVVTICRYLICYGPFGKLNKLSETVKYEVAFSKNKVIEP